MLDDIASFVADHFATFLITAITLIVISSAGLILDSQLQRRKWRKNMSEVS